MAKGKKTSRSQQENYKKYRTENRWEKNKKRKLEKHCTKHPNDKQASSALEKGFSYNRNNFKGLKKVDPPIKLGVLPPDNRPNPWRVMKESING